MAIHYLQPFRSDKNLGRAYNDAMKLIPDEDHACLRDIDTLFLTPNTPNIIEQYVKSYPNALLISYTNRVSAINQTQLFNNEVSENTDILHHQNIAYQLEEMYRSSASIINKDISGFLMVLPKHVWLRYPFPETGKCIGIDTHYGRLLRRNGVHIYRMNSVYVFHTYRLRNGVKDKTHLL